MNYELIDHNGVEVFIADYSVCKSPEDQKELLEKSLAHNMRQPDHTIYSLVIFTGQKVSPEFTNLAKDATKVAKDKIVKSAIVGITPLQRIILNAVNRIAREEMKAFNTKEEALAYLTS